MTKPNGAHDLSAAQLDFVRALDRTQGEALRDLLLLATLSDDMLTNEERVDLALTLARIGELEVFDFDTAEAVDHIDDLHERHSREAGLLVTDLLEALGEEPDIRRPVFDIIVNVMRSHGIVEDEERFARHVGALMELPRDHVDRILDDARAEEE